MQIISNTRTKRLAIPYKNIIFVNELQTYPIMKQTAYIYLLTLSCFLCACNRENRTNLPQPEVTGVADSLETVPPEEKPKAISAEQIEIKKICSMINILLKIRIRTKIRPAVFNGIRSKNAWHCSKTFSRHPRNGASCRTIRTGTARLHWYAITNGMPINALPTRWA